MNIFRLFQYPLIFVHFLLFSSIGLLLLMSNDITILLFLCVLNMNLLVLNIIFGNCPLAILEKQWYGITMSDILNDNLFITFDPALAPMFALQLIITATGMVVTKICLLLLRHVFHEFIFTPLKI